jgi:hypothetical protein
MWAARRDGSFNFLGWYYFNSRPPQYDEAIRYYTGGIKPAAPVRRGDPLLHGRDKGVGGRDKGVGSRIRKQAHGLPPRDAGPFVTKFRKIFLRNEMNDDAVPARRGQNADESEYEELLPVSPP